MSFDVSLHPEREGWRVDTWPVQAPGTILRGPVMAQGSPEASFKCSVTLGKDPAVSLCSGNASPRVSPASLGQVPRVSEEAVVTMLLSARLFFSFLLQGI